MIVLDASAVLAVIKRETGWEAVAAQANGSLLSASNLAEVVHKVVENGLDAGRVVEQIASLGITVMPATAHQAVRVGAWVFQAKELALSYADRFAAALAEDMSADLVTSDEALTKLRCGVRFIKFR